MIQLPEGVACLKCCSVKCECPERHEEQFIPCQCDFCKANYKAVRTIIKVGQKEVPAVYLTRP